MTQDLTAKQMASEMESEIVSKMDSGMDSELDSAIQSRVRQSSTASADTLPRERKRKLKQQLISGSHNVRQRRSFEPASLDLPAQVSPSTIDQTDFCQFPAYQDYLLTKLTAEQLQLANPFFKSHQGIASDTTQIDGQSYINFSSYNYLGLNQDSRTMAAAKTAIDTYGVSCSASRLVSGERPIQRELELALAQLHQVEDAAVFVSGHATNVTVIGHLFTSKDLIIHDALIHNSVIEGAKLSGATRLSFSHNDWRELDAMLTQRRDNFERVLVVVEGLYSMEGDFPDLPRMIEIKHKHRALLMVDEAHSIGVLGQTGRGIAEHFDIESPTDVDIWMGTLSKSLASTGGYIAGRGELIDMLKASAPGFLFSVGLAPAMAAAALAALQIMLEEPERVSQLQKNASLFDRLARQHGIDTGLTSATGIIPVMTGGSVSAVRLAEHLFAKGINVQPILHPAVEEKLARLRFFICSSHSEQQIIQTVDALAASMRSLSLL